MLALYGLPGETCLNRSCMGVLKIQLLVAVTVIQIQQLPIYFNDILLLVEVLWITIREQV
jgi:hypothetical protein